MSFDLNDLKFAIAKLGEIQIPEQKGEKQVGMLDPHKLCSLEAEQKKMKEDLHEYKHMVREFEKVRSQNNTL